MSKLDFDSLFSNEDGEKPTSEFLITATFRAQFKGYCTLDPAHAYKVGDFVGKVERADNPFIPVRGVACNKCVRENTHRKSVT